MTLLLPIAMDKRKGNVKADNSGSKLESNEDKVEQSGAEWRRPVGYETKTAKDEHRKQVAHSSNDEQRDESHTFSEDYCDRAGLPYHRSMKVALNDG